MFVIGTGRLAVANGHSSLIIDPKGGCPGSVAIGGKDGMICDERYLVDSLPVRYAVSISK